MRLVAIGMIVVAFLGFTQVSWASGFLSVPGPAGEAHLAVAIGELGVSAFTGGVALTLGVASPKGPRRAENTDETSRDTDESRLAIPRALEGYVVVMELIGGDTTVSPQCSGTKGCPSNIYVGRERTRWQEGYHQSPQVVYSQLWPGVDLVLRVDGLRLAYELRCDDEAMRQVSVRWRGATRVDRFRDHDVIVTPRGSVTVDPPFGTATHGWIGILKEMPSRGNKRVLMPSQGKSALDPAWSTFLGGSSVEEALAVVSNRSGRTFLTGYTESLDYPTIPGAVIVPGWDNVIVTALDEDTGFPVWSTVLTGDGLDEGRAIDILPNGNVVIAGRTFSSDFPTTPGAVDSVSAGVETSFVCELDAQTGRLAWSTLLNYCGALAIAAEKDGAVIIAGHTYYQLLGTTPGAVQPAYGGGSVDGFVARISDQGRMLDWCTYLGGSDDDDVLAVDIDSQGRPVVAGNTGQSYQWSDFPVTNQAYDYSYGGVRCGFVSKLSADGSNLVWSTFLGDGGAILRRVEIGADGRVVVAGDTGSMIYPVTAGAYQPSRRGLHDCIVSSLSADGSSLLQSTYLGGGSLTYVEGLALPSTGGILVSGQTSGPTFPGPMDPNQFTVAGENAAFLAQIDGDGHLLLVSAVFGGSDYQQNDYIAATGTGSAIVVGSTWSADFPVTAGCYDDSIGGEDIYALKVQSLAVNIALPVFEAHRVLAGAVVRWRWEGLVMDGEQLLWRQEPTGERELLMRSPIGTSGAGEYTDGTAPDGEVSYWIQVMDGSRQGVWYGPAILRAEPLPTRVTFGPCSPNPFNPRTTIRYSLPRGMPVRLALYDHRGRLVRILQDTAMPAGEQSAVWDGLDGRGRPAPSGTYVVRLVTDQGVRSSKLTLAR